VGSAAEIKTASAIQKLMGGGGIYRHRQQVYLISLLSFIDNKESRVKIESINFIMTMM
jgi:hypothetical protein